MTVKHGRRILCSREVSRGSQFLGYSANYSRSWTRSLRNFDCILVMLMQCLRGCICPSFVSMRGCLGARTAFADATSLVLARSVEVSFFEVPV